jgi:hypothetical protein
LAKQRATPFNMNAIIARYAVIKEHIVFCFPILVAWSIIFDPAFTFHATPQPNKDISGTHSIWQTP